MDTKINEDLAGAIAEMATETEQQPTPSANDYNGWANYPTWLVKLTLDNDQGLLEGAHGLYHTMNLVEVYAQRLKDYVDEGDFNGDEMTPNTIQKSMYIWAFGCVNWIEIAESYTTDLKAREEDESCG